MPFEYNRFFSSRLTRAFDRLGLTPSAVTLLGLSCGLAAGWWMSGGHRVQMLAGAACLHLAFILDNCDGELARLQGRSSRAGQWLDVTADLVVDCALWIGLFAGACARADAAAWMSLALVLALGGSAANYGMTIWERSQGRSLSSHVPRTDRNVPTTYFGKLIRLVAHDGNSVALAWPLAAFGDPAVFLVSGAAFIQGLWIGRFVLNIRPFAAWFTKVAAAPVLRTAGWLVAGGLIYTLVRDVSWPDLWELLGRIGPGFALILAVYPLGTALHLMGFYSLLSPETRARVKWHRLFPVFLIGESVNKVTPFIDVGGEPLKAALLVRRHSLSLGEAVAVTYMSRILFILTEITFVALGAGVLHLLRPSPTFLWIGAIGILMSMTLLSLLVAGSSAGLLRLVPRVAVQAGGSVAGDAALDADQVFRRMYRSRRRDLLAAVAWNQAGWFFFLLEVYVVLELLGAPASLAQAGVIQALLQAVKTVSFFVPANIGAQESGLAHLLTHLNFTGVHGIALSLLKRARQLAWLLLCAPFLPGVLAVARKAAPDQKTA